MRTARGDESMSDNWKGSKSSCGSLDKTPPGDASLQLCSRHFRARHR
jgi:hypothetical protein